MAEAVMNEQSVKRPSDFIKVSDGVKIILLSHLVRINTCWLQDVKKTIAWDDALAPLGFTKRTEYYYEVSITGGDYKEPTVGLLRLPASIFFQMNEAERLTEEDKRNSEWIIGKKGEGLETKYSAVKGKTVTPDEKKVKEATDRTLERVEALENKLKEETKVLLLRLNKGKSEEDMSLEDIDPDDIPL